MINFIRLLIFLQILQHIFSFHPTRLSSRLNHFFGVPEDYTVFNDKVEYIDLISSSYSSSTPTSKELPLFLLRNAFFPEVLIFSSCLFAPTSNLMYYLFSGTKDNIFEMKYRAMISDISRAENEFGYVQFTKGETETSFSIGRVGTICRVKNKVLYEDGKNDVLFDGIERFRINKIVKTLPYFVAEVDIIHDDEPTDNAAAIEVELEVYSALKYYLRLLPIIDPTSKPLKVTQAMKNIVLQYLTPWIMIEEFFFFSFMSYDEHESFYYAMLIANN